MKVFKQASGNKYSSVSSQKIKVSAFNDENACFLCPNQYVSYDEESELVSISQELCAEMTDDADKVRAIRDWIKSNLNYDYVLALTVPERLSAGAGQRDL